mmetsp:Transcript_8042/g.11746  ORF Transcript_8042/g.11746 Transcript_8042/m.11746 type:complete len:94 (-) Transcript_8042:1157-1438(-)
MPPAIFGCNYGDELPEGGVEKSDLSWYQKRLIDRELLRSFGALGWKRRSEWWLKPCSSSGSSSIIHADGIGMATEHTTFAGPVPPCPSGSRRC